MLLVRAHQVCVKRRGNFADGETSRLVNRIRIDDAQLLRQQLLRRKGQGQRLHRPIEARVQQHLAKRLDETLIELERLTLDDAPDEPQQDASGQLLAGLPAIEGIGVVRHQEGKLLMTAIDLQLDGSREAPAERSDRALEHIVEGKCLLCLGELESAGGAGDVLAVRTEQANPNGNRERQRSGLS